MFEGRNETPKKEYRPVIQSDTGQGPSANQPRDDLIRYFNNHTVKSVLCDSPREMAKVVT